MGVTTIMGVARKTMNKFFLSRNLSFCGLLLLVIFQLSHQSSDTETVSKEPPQQKKLYTIQGTVNVLEADISSWGPKIKILVDGGRFVGFLKQSGEFTIHNVPAGTYLVEVVHPNYVFEPARVDISSKTGKVRARKVNVLKPGSVSSLSYPLKFEVQIQASFFEKREAWSVIDMLKNPMVLFLVAPLLLMLLLPKLLNNVDPETQKEMQESMQTFQNPSSALPSMEEMFTNFFGGGGTSKKKASSSASASKKTKH